MKNALIFLGGAAVGGLAATLYFKRKMVILEEDYQRIANDEINKFLNGEYDDEIRETIETRLDEIHYNKINDKIKDSLTIIADTKNNADIEKCQEISKENGYIETEEENISDEDEVDEQVAPYMITPDEYGDDEHTTRTLTAFTDKVILDEDNCLFNTNYFGKDIIETIYSKKNVDSSIFVRDDNDKIDYEIIKEKISFEDFTKLTESEKEKISFEDFTKLTESDDK